MHCTLLVQILSWTRRQADITSDCDKAFNHLPYTQIVYCNNITCVKSNMKVMDQVSLLSVN